MCKGPRTDDLYEVEVSVIDQEYCKQQYAPSTVADEMICAGDLDGGRGVCQVQRLYFLLFKS